MTNNTDFISCNPKIYRDYPIVDATNFNFDIYSKTIASIILNPKNKTPFVIAINGKWGSGKTTLLKTIKTQVESQSGKENNRIVKTIWFNAWRYSESESLFAALLQEMYNELISKGLRDKKFKKLKYAFNYEFNAIKQITDLVNLLTGGLGPDFKNWRKTPPYEDKRSYFDEFQKFFSLLIEYAIIENKKEPFTDEKGVILIFIDDLDRCSPYVINKIMESLSFFLGQCLLEISSNQYFDSLFLNGKILEFVWHCIFETYLLQMQVQPVLKWRKQTNPVRR